MESIGAKAVGGGAPAKDTMGFGDKEEEWGEWSVLGSASNGLLKLLKEDGRQLKQLQEDLWASLQEHDDPHWAKRFATPRSFGERAADKVASLGGSWPFVFSFVFAILVWVTINLTLSKSYDPFPFSLLNLFLSMLAALQAPIIMMSQNRQTERDRAIAHYTGRVNCRAELQVRHVNAKLDLLLSSVWKRVLEVDALHATIMESSVKGGSAFGGSVRAGEIFGDKNNRPRETSEATTEYASYQAASRLLGHGNQTMEMVYSESDMILDEVFQVMDSTTQDASVRAARPAQTKRCQKPEAIRNKSSSSPSPSSPPPPPSNSNEEYRKNEFLWNIPGKDRTHSKQGSAEDCC